MCVCVSLSLCALTVTTPYTKAEFGTAEQGKYKAAVAAAARTAAANVDILSVTDTESQRRAGSVEVETKVMLSLLLLAGSLLSSALLRFRVCAALSTALVRSSDSSCRSKVRSLTGAGAGG